MKIRNTSDEWGLISIGLHWLTVVVVIGLFFLGLWMISLNYNHLWYQTAPHLHRSIGVIVFILTCLRLVWNVSNLRPESIPKQARRIRYIAKFVHGVLYALLFMVMLSGYLITTAKGDPVNVFNWFTIPATIYGIERQEDYFGEIHWFLAVSLIALMLLHAGVALKHHYIDKDHTLRNMLGKSIITRSVGNEKSES